MKNLLIKTKLVFIGLSILIILVSCGGEQGGDNDGDEKINKAKETTTETKETNSPEVISHNLEKGYYYEFRAYMQIPVYTTVTDIYEKFGERTKDKKEEKDTYIQLIFSIENIKLDGNKFSGSSEFVNGSSTINNENWNSWQGKKQGIINNTISRCSGELSKDHKIIKYIEIEELWFSHSGELKEAHRIEKRRDYVVLTNLPVYRGDEKDSRAKKFRFKYQPTVKVDGSSIFLDDAKDIISGITDSDKIDYYAKHDLRKDRKGKIIKDVWEERNEIFSQLNQDNISYNKPTWTITFIKEKKIPDIEIAKEEIKEDNKEWLGEIKGGKLLLEESTFVSGNKMTVGFEYKFRNNSVNGDDINEIYVGIIPKDEALDFLFENLYGNKKYKVSKNELIKYKKDPEFSTKQYLQFVAPELATNVLTGEQADFETFVVVLFFLDPSGKKIAKVDNKSIIVLKKESVGGIRISGDNKTYKAGDKIEVIYHEEFRDKVEITDMWVGILNKETEPELTPSKSDFIATKDIKQNKNERLFFIAPNEPGKYKTLLYKLELPFPISELNFEVIE